MLNSFQPTAPRLGKIRLGVKKIAASGSEYPTSTEYFVLDSLDEDLKRAVVGVYGPEPRELDIIFPSDDPSLIIPTWLKLYSGATKNSKGETIGGKLRCYGSGPDREGNPGTAVHIERKDPITGIYPQRPCMGPTCPDWKDSKGRQQCHPRMKVLAVLPRVSHYGVFEIDTGSWYSIASFHNLVEWVKSFNNGVIKGIPLKIAREETLVTFTGPDGAQKTSKQHIMKLFPNEGFAEKYGDEVLQKLTSTFKNVTLSLPSAEEIIERPEGHAYALAEGEEDRYEAEVVQNKISTAEDLIKDPEIMNLFTLLEKATGKAYSDKARLISVRKFESEPNFKEAVKASMAEKIQGIENQKQES